MHLSPGWHGTVGWASSCEPKSPWFDSWSGHMPGLQVQSLVRACVEGNRWVFLSLSFSLPSPLSKIKKYICLKNHLAHSPNIINVD